MPINVEAIYENGVLKPTAPLPIKEHEKVQITVHSASPLLAAYGIMGWQGTSAELDRLLAEIDLDLRGEGTIMGERQKGRNDLRLASLRRDREWVVTAREIAIEILDADPELVRHELLAEEVDLFLKADDIDFLMKS